MRPSQIIDLMKPTRYIRDEHDLPAIMDIPLIALYTGYSGVFIKKQMFDGKLKAFKGAAKAGWRAKKEHVIEWINSLIEQSQRETG